MRTDHICPCCKEGHLELLPPKEICHPYRVECPHCGTMFHHDLLWHGYNGAQKFLQNIDAGEPEVDSVFNSAYDDAHAWVCSGCGKRRTLVTNAPPFRFCPDCGKPVEPSEVADGD